MSPAGEQKATPGDGQALSADGAIRKNAAIIVSLLLFAAGSYALYHLLAPLNLKAVLASLQATPWQVYLPAILATMVGYLALIGYDWSALHYIGRRLPFPYVALGGFLGYAFGNTIGLSALSGGAVRYRIYAALGLDGYDVAAIASFAAVAYGVGATIVGLSALAVHPSALEGLWSVPAATVRAGAIIAVAGIVLLLAGLALRGKSISVGRFSLRAPTFGEMLRQMAFSLTDICMATLVLYLLLPSGSLPFANLLAVFAIATMVGVASHVPGGVGVFESVVIAALPASVPLSDAVTALLLFRLIYFLLPFIVALALLSAIEVWTATGRKTPTMTHLMPALDAGRSVIPIATGVLVLSSGLFMMFAGLLPNPQLTVTELETILPLAMIEGGAMVSSIIGSLLVVLALALFRRSRAAFWLVLMLLIAGVAIAILRQHDIERVMLLAAMTVILLPCRREFYRAARITQGLWSTQWIAFILAVAGIIWLTFYAVHESAPFATLTWWQFTFDGDAAQAQRAILAISVVLGSALLFSALRARRVAMVDPDPESLARAWGILDQFGQGGDMLAVTGDKMLMFAPNGDAVLSYGVKGASWVALGAPVGTKTGREDLAWEFHDAARAAGARPVFYEAPPDFTDQAIEMGLALHKMGEEAVVMLARFSLEGPERKKLRASHARALRDGLTLELLFPRHSDAILAEASAVSDDWLTALGAKEKTFSVGRFDRDYLQRFPLVVVRHDGRMVAFANLLTAEGRKSAAIDLMRYGSDAPSGTMEFLFTELMLRLAHLGYAEFSLGMAPFAGLSARRGADLWSKSGVLVYRYGDRFYNFDGLRRFKDKFDPEWRPRYFCCRSILPPVALLADVARLIRGNAHGLEHAQDKFQQ